MAVADGKEDVNHVEVHMNPMMSSGSGLWRRQQLSTLGQLFLPNDDRDADATPAPHGHRCVLARVAFIIARKWVISAAGCALRACRARVCRGHALCACRAAGCRCAAVGVRSRMSTLKGFQVPKDRAFVTFVPSQFIKMFAYHVLWPLSVPLVGWIDGWRYVSMHTVCALA
jgi:hypothetical protein